MHRYWSCGTLIIAGMLLAGCGSHTQKPASPHPNALSGDSPVPPGVNDTTSANLAQAHAHYGAGVVHDMEDDSEAALQEYYQAAKLDPDNEGLVLDVSRRFLQAKQPEKALEVLAKAADRPGASSEF